jgi:hypothetical protein
MKIILSILLPLVIIVGVICDSFVSLQTKLGPIRGLSSSVNINNATKYYTVFKKVPFAKPPVGDLHTCLNVDSLLIGSSLGDIGSLVDRIVECMKVQSWLHQVFRSMVHEELLVTSLL